MLELLISIMLWAELLDRVIGGLLRIHKAIGGYQFL
jgi:hypothetical protein